jgi:hypothetical protein
MLSTGKRVARNCVELSYLLARFPGFSRMFPRALPCLSMNFSGACWTSKNEPSEPRRSR